MTDLEVLSFISLKMFYAVMCGFIVGVERKINHAPAGFKTQILVCVGAMLFTCIPVIVGATMITEQARVIAQIVTGVGFLGAGAIMNKGGERRNVAGLTTAAWIWFTAAVGIMSGVGHGLVALFVTSTLVAVISIARFVERKYFPSDSHSHEEHPIVIKDKSKNHIRKVG